MATQAQAIEQPDRIEVRTRFGKLPVKDDNLLDFPQGLPGFRELRRFALFHDIDNRSVFYLQSTEDPEVRLPLTSPHWFDVHYQITLTNEESDLLGVEDPKDLTLLVTVREGSCDASGPQANFNGPVIINLSKRIAMQKSLHDPRRTVTIEAD